MESACCPGIPGLSACPSFRIAIEDGRATDHDPADSSSARVDLHDVRVVRILLEPPQGGRVSSRDRDVVEPVETARKRENRHPSAVLVRRDTDTPLVGDGSVPGGDDTVAFAGREYVWCVNSVLPANRRFVTCDGIYAPHTLAAAFWRKSDKML